MSSVAPLIFKSYLTLSRNPSGNKEPLFVFTGALLHCFVLLQVAYSESLHNFPHRAFKIHGTVLLALVLEDGRHAAAGAEEVEEVKRPLASEALVLQNLCAFRKVAFSREFETEKRVSTNFYRKLFTKC